ncbi:hypothetical protein [Novosphingobium sp. AP12]|uniref:hypothetical protein n=1 Tax=Novosphingobium sp. AP12 TaxID=1144305 RepID=UPI0003075683|nr:hypothetical protein [Novosphingobium sp. AP12]
MRIKLAMKIGGKYRLREISMRNWEKLCEEVALDPVKVFGRIREMAARLPGEAMKVRGGMQAAGMNHRLVDRLTECLKINSWKCAELLTSA